MLEVIHSVMDGVVDKVLLSSMRCCHLDGLPLSAQFLHLSELQP
jgi:hypothetical protein